jgi:hypothetical protein
MSRSINEGSSHEVNQPRRKNMTDEKKPEPVLRLHTGGREVAVWKIERGKGPRFSVTTYKQGEERKQSDSLGEDEQIVMDQMLDIAHTWIATKQQRDNSLAVPDIFGTPPAVM